jgi:hypothetical protein
MGETMESQPVLDLQHLSSARRLSEPVRDRRAWTRETLGAREWTLPLSAAVQDELARAGAVLRANPLPVALLQPGVFDQPHSRALMEQVRRRLEAGMGQVIVDRFDLDALERDTAIGLYWLLGGYLAPRVAQKWDGTLVYDVKDTGRAFGYGVRASWTNAELVFHNDNAFAAAVPDYVSLLCLNPARSGGVSRLCSLYTVHNRLLERHPRQLERLYRPVYFDRQAEHAPDAPPVALAPPLRFDGRRLSARLNSTLVRRGYERMDRRMDEDLVEALAALDGLMTDESLWVEFTIERGQIQYLSNTDTAHFRSEFLDADEPERKRHLVRLWYRNEGRPFYDG